MGAQTYLPIEILDYVETHAPTDESPFGISQRELAKALGYHPCSMSRPLASLVVEGYLTQGRGLVREGVRRQLTYRITEPGRTRLRRETREVPLLSGEIPPPPHPFLGRKEELTQLADFAREGSGITFVDGPPGMGKTALVSRHLRSIKRGRIPFWFSVRPASSPRQFVSALTHALSSLGAHQLAYYTQLPRPPVAREVADLVARSLGNRSLVAVIDDVQMAGPDMKAFLASFTHFLAARGNHLFYLVSQTEPAFEPEGVSAHRLTVGGLDRAAAHDLTDRRGGLADRFELVYQSTLGSPLLLELAVSNPDVEADATSLPTAVVARLSQDDIRAVLPVALANEPIPVAFASEIEGTPVARLIELERMGVLHRTLQGRVEVLQVVKTALLARATPPDEREAHSRLALYYSRSHRPDAVRERFLHLVEGEFWKAAAQLLSQQETTLLRLGYSETLRNALRHLSNVLPRGQMRVRVLQVEATLLRLHSDYSDAISTLRRAISESNRDPRTTGECLLSIAELYIRLHQVDEAQEAFQASQRIGPVSRRLHAFLVLTEARLAQARGEDRLAQSGYEEAFEVCRKVHAGDLALESIAAWSRLAELHSGPEVALRLIADALPEARQAGRMDVAFNLQLVRARAYARLGQDKLAEVEMRTIRSEAEALGYMSQLTYAFSGLASLAGEGGRWAEAVNYAKQASALAERLGNDFVLGHTLAVLCATENRQAQAIGNPDSSLVKDAIVHGERSLEVLAKLPPSDSLVLAHTYLSEVYADQHDRERASQYYNKAMELVNQLQLPWLKEKILIELKPKIFPAT
ncbi:MAG TPA: AAA family ATPase [Thermoplasmata archaeon]|jgi:tetratricopeptide (TPR) repeat protein/DNA-binding MarR family transcriptional regulator